MKKLLLLIAMLLLGGTSYVVNAQEAGGNYPGLIEYQTLADHCDYQYGSTLKFSNCDGKYGILADRIIPKLTTIKKTIYIKMRNANERYDYLNALNQKLEEIKHTEITNGKPNDVTRLFLIEIIQQEIVSWMEETASLDSFLEEIFNDTCTEEGEVFGARGLESEKCCAGSEAMQYIGGSSICYNPSRGKPSCRIPMGRDEGYLIYSDGGDLKPYAQTYSYACDLPITETCAKEGEISNASVGPEYYKPCCYGLEGFDHNNAFAGQPQMVGGGVICVDPNKGTPVCDYPERIQNGYQGPFYEAPYWIYPDGSGISTDPNVLGTYQCDPSTETKLTISDSSGNGTFNGNHITPGDNANAGYFNLKAEGSDIYIEEIRIEQIGTLNGTDFDEVKMIKSINGEEVGQCYLNSNEYCNMDLELRIDPNNLETYCLEVSIDNNISGEETIEFKITDIDVEDDNTGVKINAKNLPFIINRWLLVN